MARRNGWQFPAHSLQVAAMAVFLLLSIVFYIFFAPFLGNDVYEYVALAVYSVLVFFVLILYVRCTAIDPADSGVMISDRGSVYSSKRDKVSLEDPSNVGLKTEEHSKKYKATSCSIVGCFVCNLLVKEDCCKNDNIFQQQENTEGTLFCSLCDAEVGKFSKHCRSCDKCVDGFDHHCRWLNNCIGRKNYITFLLLMATSMAWLTVEIVVGIAVFVRCFLHNSTIKMRIHDRLGDGFSIIPLAIIVGIGTSFSLVALFPIAELFFFHVILVKKGITTYDYIVAMRAESDPPGPSINEDPQSPLTSPMSSVATAISGNSIGLQYRGAWCTPPRIFMDNQDEIVPHLDRGAAHSTVDPDSINTPKSGKRQGKKQVSINPWKLVKLDSGEASRAAAKARASSSVLRPISSRPNYEQEQERLSVANTSGRMSPYKSPFSTPPHDTGPRFNPMYQTSSNQSRSPSCVDNNSRVRSSNSRSSVYWDQEAGRFVSSENGTGSVTSRAHTEMMYAGNSIFFGGPLLSGGGMQRRGNDQLPVFLPRGSST